jgi:tRNA modification GTPase
MSAPVDTIAAIATPPGRGGVGIVRVSGPLARAVAGQMLGRVPVPRYAHFTPFHDPHGGLLDSGIALFFPAPHSFTGEDVLELQGHGGPVVLDAVLRAVFAAGVRPARPGEFTERAFLNGKLDLAQAEAVADLIDSASTEAARLALNSLQGHFSTRIRALVEQLTALRTFVEAAIDFSDEEIDFLSEGGVAERLAQTQEELEAVRQAAWQGTLLREGMTLVIAGQPNAGKSSLLNALAGRERAIVTDIPGTTRDVLREQILIDGLPLHIVDTAGLRDSSDPVEQEGIRRAWEEIARADRLLLITDATRGLMPEDRTLLDRFPSGVPVTVVRNKIDLSGESPGFSEGPFGPELRLSARRGEGVDLLREHLKGSVGFHAGEGLFMARRRHLEALLRAADHLERAATQLRDFRAGELVAEELRLAQNHLGEITGAFSSDDLLGRIFSDFCIGK